MMLIFQDTHSALFVHLQYMYSLKKTVSQIHPLDRASTTVIAMHLLDITVAVSDTFTTFFTVQPTWTER